MKKIICMLFMAALCYPTMGSAAPIGAPFSVWSNTTYDKEGKIAGMLHVEQGLDWFELAEKVRINTFVGGDLYGSNRPDNYWENMVSPEIGLKATYRFTPIKGGYASVEGGVKYKVKEYFGHESESGLEAFFGVNLGGDWLNGRGY
ncbi:MAG: hypothetical protein HGA67_00700 [Candidatus Yonathbacteria bacterium]|nr:hypothetical protein [Candidatus Yonathbacteria bacterium]